MNFFTAFSRAAQGMALTPQERAWLKLVEGLLTTFLVACISMLGTLSATGHLAFNSTSLDLVIGAGFEAMVIAGKKLISAQGDTYASAPLHQQDGQTPTPAAPVSVSETTPAPAI